MIKQFHHKDFLPLRKIYSKKQESDTAISVVIPAYNEVSTIGSIISQIKHELIDVVPLCDEIVVIDGDSDDGTLQCAKDSGATVYRVSEIGENNLPRGKGAALWKSLFVTQGDIIVCIDGDIKDFDVSFVYGLIAPLLYDSSLSFIKGYYERPMVIDDVTLDNHGGRVTEILVRPLLSTFYPELARLFQPLAGEYSFRKKTISQLPFYSGYGVEIGLILDLYKSLGLSAIAQVDMDIRCHRNRSIADLGKMAFGIFHVILKKLEEDNKISFSQPIYNTMISLGSNGWEENMNDECVLYPYAKSKGGIV